MTAELRLKPDKHLRDLLFAKAVKLHPAKMLNRKPQGYSRLATMNTPMTVRTEAYKVVQRVCFLCQWEASIREDMVHMDILPLAATKLARVSVTLTGCFSSPSPARSVVTNNTSDIVWILGSLSVFDIEKAIARRATKVESASISSEFPRLPTKLATASRTTQRYGFLPAWMIHPKPSPDPLFIFGGWTQMNAFEATIPGCSRPRLQHDPS